jgi:hypothetical protein
MGGGIYGDYHWTDQATGGSAGQDVGDRWI